MGCEWRSAVKGRWERRRHGSLTADPLWWPVLVGVLTLVAGLAALAANPREASEPVRIYSATERPTPIPLDSETDRRVDLNRASRAELEALPGIGEARAEAILTARAEAPFRTPREVVQRGVLPLRVMAELRGIATVFP